MRIALASFLCLVTIACTGDPDRGNTPMTQEVVTGSDCRNEASVIRANEDPERALEGDVDGDGSADTVYLAQDEDAEPGCRSFVAVDTGARLISAPVDPLGTERSLPKPALRFVVPINDVAGDEVVVNIEMGASTEFVGVFTTNDDGLARIELDGKGPGPFAQELGKDALLAFGGSVGHMEAVDCATRDGFVVLSAAVPSGSSADVYEVERRFFRADGSVLTLVPALTEKHTVKNLAIEDFSEFARSPFGSCD